MVLVAVTVTLEAVVPVAVSVVAGALPVALDGLTEPAPVTAKPAPEALESFVTAAANASVWPESSVMPVVEVVNEIAMGFSVMVAVVDLVLSLTLAAVTVTVTGEVPLTTAGAV